MLDLADRPTTLDGPQTVQPRRQVRGLGDGQAAQLKAPRCGCDRRFAKRTLPRAGWRAFNHASTMKPRQWPM